MRPYPTLVSFAAALVCAALGRAQSFAPYGVSGAKPLAATEQSPGGSTKYLTVDASVSLPKSAPDDGEGARAFTLTVPTPAGATAELTLREASVFSAGAQARYDDIRTYRGTDDGGHAAAVTSGPSGLQVFVADGPDAYVIAAAGRGRAVLRVLREERSAWPAGLACGYDAEAAPGTRGPTKHAASGKPLAQVEKRTYVMALAATGEFSRRRGGTVAGVNEAFAEALNILNAKIVSETAVEFRLHPDNDTLIFLDPGLDPYRDPTLGRALLQENADAINRRLPVGTYDIGHVFTNGCRDVAGGGQREHLRRRHEGPRRDLCRGEPREFGDPDDDPRSGAPICREPLLE